MRDRGAVTAWLAGLVTEDLDEEALARHVCEACVEGLDIDGAALSVMPTEATRQTLWATDEVAVLLEDLQFSLNEGACIEAATFGAPGLVCDLAEAVELARWPVFAVEVADRTPARALFALPLQWGTVTIGVLDLYRLRTGEFSAAEWQDLLGVAEIAALLLLSRRTRPESELLGPGGADGEGNPGEMAGLGGVFARPEIHQAVGMVLVQLGIGPEEALARMRARAFGEQRLLADVARDVVERRVVFTEEME